MLQEDAGRLRQGSGPQVMVGVRNLMIDGCSSRARRAWRRGTATDMCHPENPVELELTSIGE